MAEANLTIIVKPVPNFPNYRVGNDGSVWSNYVRGHRRIGPWRKLKPSINHYGYPVVVLIDPTGGRRTLRVHSLVLLAFIGPCPKGMEACHNDGNRSNSRLENLRWDTHESNLRDKCAHGTDRRGEEIPSAKLGEKAIKEIRSRYASGSISQRQLAIMYGVGVGTIHYVVTRKTWNHVT